MLSYTFDRITSPNNSPIPSLMASVQLVLISRKVFTVHFRLGRVRRIVSTFYAVAGQGLLGAGIRLFGMIGNISMILGTRGQRKRTRNGRDGKKMIPTRP